uniref:Uncharacterized protein n=1 Tax=Ditylum brightwellii TaxID=49249 RepID=A0A7S4SI09_9STRA
MPSSMPSATPSIQVFLCDIPSSMGVVGLADSKIVAETGKVVLQNTISSDIFVNITFRRTYSDPVVLAFVNSRNDWNSVAPRVKDVTPNGCIVFMHNPSNSSHGTELVSYFVAEKGRYELHGGAIFEAGSHDTSTAHEGGQNYIGDQLWFTEPFQNMPAVLHTLNTYNNADFMTSLATDINTDGFQIAQEYAETTPSSVVQETIAWIAFETGSGTSTGSKYVIGIDNDRIDNGVDNEEYIIDYTLVGYETPPDLVAAVNLENGNNGAWARGSGTFSNTQQGVFAEEDQEDDPERSHTNELCDNERHHESELISWVAFEVAWVAFESCSDLIQAI